MIYYKKRHKINHIIYFVIIVLILFSCNYDRVFIEKKSYSEWLIEEDHSNDKIQINFEAGIQNQYINARNVSKTLIDTERLITIYAYSVSADSKLEKTVEYKTVTIGSLTPITSPMFLYPNIYSLYAVGINEENVAIPKFTDGIATNIQNGMDYIWDGLWDIDITTIGNNDTVQIEFNHCCTQILIDLVVDTGIVVNSVPSVSLTPPDITGLEWNLFNQGIIGPATAINSNESDMVNIAFEKTNFGFRSSYIMIPIKVDTITEMLCKFMIAIDNEDFDRTYQLKLPVYENNMESGYSYKYNVALDRDTIFYNGVEITDWYIIDINSDTLVNE